MYREILHGNRLCNDKSILRLQKHHADNLTKIHGRKKGSGTLDNRVPSTKKMAHLARNFKKEQMMEERFSRIERENRILLEKMSFIMQKDTMTEEMNASSSQYAHSLNRDMRKRELAKITGQNQLILRRIQMKQPTYDHLQWEEDARRNQQYGENVREYKTGGF